MIAEFTKAEVELLNEILAQANKEIAVEIHRTDSLQYRAGLVQRQETLAAIQKSLGAAPQAARA